MQRGSSLHKFLLVILSVALLSAGWLVGTGLTLLVALIPLLIISENYTSSTRDWWRMCGWAALTFLLWYAATIWWVWIAAPIGPIAAGIVGTFYNLCAFMTYHYVSKRGPRALAYTLLIAIWIATEWAYNSADVMTFPWLLLGNGFSGDVWAVQWYEYTGIFGGTLWALCSNVAIFEILRTRTTTAKVRAAIFIVAPIILSLTLLYTYTPSGRHAQISVIQPNVPCYPEERMAADKLDPTADVERLMGEVPATSTFVLMPESAMAYLPRVGSINEANIESIAPVIRDIYDNKPSATKAIAGASTMRYYGDMPATETARYSDIYGWYDYFNSALLCNSGGAVEDIYHKGRLVIGVEAVPLKELFDLFEVDLGGVAGQLGWGKEFKIFENNGVRIAPAICYEGLYGEFMTGFANKGAEVIGVISNDGWWGNTPGHKRLFDFCRLRAIECRRAIARSANTGISGFISPIGTTIGDRLTWDEEGTLTAQLELRSDKTIYVLYGDWIARIATYIAVLSLLYYVAYRIRKRNHLVD
ncbi:MAG: apolipoprotein N-acyltransferase [Alistipes sp.]|nr:apolipoprotein N-acyltransferase [Alistipes sp.]